MCLTSAAYMYIEIQTAFVIETNSMNPDQFALLGNFSSFYCRLLTFFFKINFFKKFFQEHFHECEMVWVLIKVQTVHKGYQQMTIVATNKKRVNPQLKMN